MWQFSLCVSQVVLTVFVLCFIWMIYPPTISASEKEQQRKYILPELKIYFPKPYRIEYFDIYFIILVEWRPWIWYSIGIFFLLLRWEGWLGSLCHHKSYLNVSFIYISIKWNVQKLFHMNMSRVTDGNIKTKYSGFRF